MRPATKQSTEVIRLTETYGAHNYHPLPIVIAKAEGAWVWDPEGNRYLDMLSAYSALNQGHRHPRIIDALKQQADKVTLTSRAFHNDKLGPFYQKLSELTKKQRILPMNTGAEAVETAIKAARRWAYRAKGIPENQAEIIVCANNFHGRTVTAISMSSNDEYKVGFGPLTPGFKVVEYGNLEKLQQAFTEHTAAFMVEPIQGEAGIIIPPDGYLQSAMELCKRNDVLFIADEIQTGFGRTGKLFASEWENVTPDIYVLGKALGGGVMPISAIAADDAIMSVFEPGSHGSTFGGNPLACAVAIAAMDVIVDEDLPARSLKLGEWMLNELLAIPSPHIQDVRGRGLFIGVELDGPARPYCEALMREGLLCKETHEHVIRFAPPLVVDEEDLKQAVEKIRRVLNDQA